MSDAQVQAEFAGGIAGIHRYLPGYNVQTLALPYGVFPRSKRLLVSGKSGSLSYRHLCVQWMRAGIRPAHRSLKGFKPYRIPRIIPGDERTKPGSLNTIRYWLAYLEKHTRGEVRQRRRPKHLHRPRLGTSAELDTGNGCVKRGFQLRTYSGTRLTASRIPRFRQMGRLKR